MVVKAEDSVSVLHFSDIHLEDESVFGENWGWREEYSEEVYDRLESLIEDTDHAMFNGDCGTGEDWEDLEELLADSDLRDWVMVPGNSDIDTDYVSAEDIGDPDSVENNTRNFEVEAGDESYRILLSRVPQNIGIRFGKEPDRNSYVGEKMSAEFLSQGKVRMTSMLPPTIMVKVAGSWKTVNGLAIRFYSSYLYHR